MATKAFQKIYTKISQITKATCSLKASGVGYDELAMVNGKLAQVVKIMGDEVTLQVFEGTEGIPTNAEVVFLGKSPTLKVSEQLAGRFFNAFGDPIDGGPEIEGQEVPIGGPSVNPVRRKQPSELIATGIAGIDLNNTLVSGQKIPFFADPDQPFNQVMANVALRAETDKIILGGMGMTNDDYLYFKNVFSNAGALDRIISFVNTTENPPVERLLIPDMALTAAEYFAVEHNQKVLVLLTDMTSYADALAIVSNRMDQIPSKDSMPGSLYSDLAKIYEKAVQFPAGGSITIIAVTTLSGGDITHAVPDNTGYITEGQLFLRRDSDIGKVIVDPFRSLSRLKQLVSGKKTRKDHPQVMNAAVRLYADAADHEHDDEVRGQVHRKGLGVDVTDEVGIERAREAAEHGGQRERTDLYLGDVDAAGLHGVNVVAHGLELAAPLGIDDAPGEPYHKNGHDEDHVVIRDRPLHAVAEEVIALDAAQALCAVRHALHVVEQHADDLREGDGRQGEVHAAQAQARIAERLAGEPADAQRRHKAEPRRNAELHIQQTGNVGAHGEHTGRAEVHLAGQAGACGSNDGVGIQTGH